jgi:hypothetical protein
MAGDGKQDLPPGTGMLLAMAGAAALMLPIAGGMLGTSPLTPIATRMESALNVSLPLAQLVPIAAAPHHMHHRRAVPAARIVATEIPPAAATPKTATPEPAMAAPPPESAQVPAVPAVIHSYVSPALPVIESTEDMQCRRPQQLPGSRLPGPMICKPKNEWAALQTRKLDVAPDGRIYNATEYQTARALEGRACSSLPTGASTANRWTTTCF